MNICRLNKVQGKTREMKAKLGHMKDTGNGLQDKDENVH